jgi:hypothetical protein
MATEFIITFSERRRIGLAVGKDDVTRPLFADSIVIIHCPLCQLRLIPHNIGGGEWWARHPSVENLVPGASAMMRRLYSCPNAGETATGRIPAE